MKKLTYKDTIQLASGGQRYMATSVMIATDLLHAPLAWQERGLQQTASGYGAKLVTQTQDSFLWASISGLCHALLQRWHSVVQTARR